ncbi:hypothetical protein BC936DRAFT_136655 [Jimgerdemannia flammicorona]|uniref:Uncharacterized protein n=1 Tax=Jimgerdemannia flammicorona TaxID=994334 RepID=A0A433DJG6_9FUNG|nr:hypothetical protein BC936DRAFT_136655 [Jimgerdemannia flammicorona]
MVHKSFSFVRWEICDCNIVGPSYSASYAAPPPQYIPMSQPSAPADGLLGITNAASLPTPPSSGLSRPVSPLSIESPAQRLAEGGELKVLE